MHAPSIIEFYPLFILEFIRVATITGVRPSTYSWLAVWVVLFVLLSKLSHKFFGKSAQSCRHYDYHTDNPTLEAQDETSE